MKPILPWSLFSNKYPNKLRVIVLYMDYHSSNGYNVLKYHQYYNSLEWFVSLKSQKSLYDLV